MYNLPLAFYVWQTETVVVRLNPGDFKAVEARYIILGQV
jgi:hypothetical protein